MKPRNFLIAIVLVFGVVLNVNRVYAQVAQQKQDKVTLNIKLQPFQIIKVNSAQTNVDLLYASATNYDAGVTSTQEGHLEIFSTGGFIVTVNTDGDFTRKATGGGTILASDVIVSATGIAEETTYGTFPLSKSGGTLITSNKGGRGLTYDVTYDNTTAGGSDNYINKYIATDGTESVYTAEVTYTITAQ